MDTYVGVRLPEIADFSLQECISICLHIHSVVKDSPGVPLCLGTKALSGVSPGLFTERRC